MAPESTSAVDHDFSLANQNSCIGVTNLVLARLSSKMNFGRKGGFRISSGYATVKSESP